MKRDGERREMEREENNRQERHRQRQGKKEQRERETEIDMYIKASERKRTVEMLIRLIHGPTKSRSPGGAALSQQPQNTKT